MLSCFLKWLNNFSLPLGIYGCPKFFKSSPMLVIHLFDYSHSNMHGEIFHFCLDLHFYSEYLCASWLFVYIIWKMSSHIFTHFLFGDLSFNSWVLMVLCIFWTMNPYQIYDFQIYSSTLWFVFSHSWHYPLKHISFNLIAAKWSNCFPFLLILLLMLLVWYFKINWLIQGQKYVSILKKMFGSYI